MKKLFEPVLNFLLFSNVFMGLCAAAQGLVTFYLIGAKPVIPVIWLLFTSTIGIYNFCILLARPSHPQLSAYKRVRWFFSHYQVIVTVTLVSLLSLIPLFFLMAVESRILLVFLSIISFSYSIPLFAIGGQKIGLRNIPGLKQFLITLVWALSTVLLPIMEARHVDFTSLSMRDTTILIAKRFLFIAAIAIPFDIRDLFEDKRLGLKTLPVVWGEKNAYLFCQVLLAGYIVLLFLFKGNGFNAGFWALSVTIALAAWLIFKSKWEKNEYYYFFYLDGMLILQYLALVVFNGVNSLI